MESIEKTAKPEGTLRDRLAASPHLAGILTLLESRYEHKEAPADIETIKDIFFTFFEQGIENSELFTSEKYNVAFPYTSFDTAALAKELYAHYQPLPEGSSAHADTPIRNQEFVMGSFLNPASGSQFTFFEEALHQLLSQLPSALDAIKDGVEPKRKEIYVLGSPSNEYGTMSEEFLDTLTETDSMKQFGGLYAEFIASKLPTDPEERAQVKVLLYGISMGGSFATQAAEQLLAQGVVTQSRDDADTGRPLMQVRADTLPGASGTKNMKWQIPFGFAADSVITLKGNPYTSTVVMGDAKWTSVLRPILADRGMVPNMSPEQEKMKKAAVLGRGLFPGKSGVIGNLRHGIPIDPDLKLTEVRGMYDPLQYSNALRNEVLQQREEHPNSLGTNTASVSENWRRVVIDQAHTLMFFRENELNRLERAAAALEQLRRGSQDNE